MTTRTAADLAVDLPRASIYHPPKRRWERGTVIALEYAGRGCSFYRIRVGRETVRVDARKVRRAAVEVPGERSAFRVASARADNGKVA
jgi:hypothetical protein